jgi:hypothetical protein
VTAKTIRLQEIKQSADGPLQQSFARAVTSMPRPRLG